jgi:chorismate dehydratase
LLREDKLDAALVSITEVLLNDRYDVLDGVAVASLGEVQSVFLAHRQPLENVWEIYCDTASLASVNLLKVLLAERGINATMLPLPSYERAASLDNVLLIGDPAIHFLRSKPAHQIWDLGAAWFELTQLPFVYAVWALRRIPNELLRRRLREAKNFGMDTLDYIILSRTEFDQAFRKDYLGWHIHFHLGAEERRGIARFIELLRKHNLGPVYEPRFVS